MSTSIGNAPKPQDMRDRTSPDAERDFAESEQVDDTLDTHPASTTKSSEGQKAKPRLPHERDESSDSQRQEARPIIQRAHDDVESGLVDTDRGTPMNEAYKKQQSSGGPKYR
jgi:hypothetical protein